MQINNVAFDINGNFLVNNKSMAAPANEPTNRLTRKVQAWIDAGNTPTPYVGPTALELWEQQMASSDKVLPRWAEDLIDQQGIVGLAQATVDKYNGKKSLRATKP